MSNVYVHSVYSVHSVPNLSSVIKESQKRQRSHFVRWQNYNTY